MENTYPTRYARVQLRHKVIWGIGDKDTAQVTLLEEKEEEHLFCLRTFCSHTSITPACRKDGEFGASVNSASSRPCNAS